MEDMPIKSDELLSRFVLQSKWLRADNSIKPECFMPHPYVDLSVFRQINIPENELWNLGNGVSNKRGLTLYGRADIIAKDIFNQRLTVESSEPPQNHANIKTFPSEKAEQKRIAQELAKNAYFISISCSDNIR